MKYDVDKLRTLFYWISERMAIFWRRYHGGEPPYTEDVILQQWKFTNVYRVLDRVSQSLVKDVINKEFERPEDMFWRILLFRHFNQPRTWDYLESQLGAITYGTRKEDIIEALHAFDHPVYSNAYLLTSNFILNDKVTAEYGLRRGAKRFELYMPIFYQYYQDYGKVSEILSSRSRGELCKRLTEQPGFSNFLGMQYTDDLCWSTLFNFDENSFVMASVGSKRGIDRIFTLKHKQEEDYQQAIVWTWMNFQTLMDEFGFEFNPIAGRLPKLMDIQNCFCEIDKYMRQLDNIKGMRIKARFRETPEPIDFELPHKWKLGMPIQTKRKTSTQTGLLF